MLIIFSYLPHIRSCCQRRLRLLIDSVGDLLGHVRSQACGPVRGNVNLGSSHSTLETKLRSGALNPVNRVDVLHQRDLVARCRSLAGNDGGIGKEVLPDLGILSIKRW